MRTADRVSGRNKRWVSVWLRSLHQINGAALLVAAIISLAVPRTMVWAAVPQGVWLIDAKVAAATPLTAYYDSRYVEEVKRSGFFDQLWK